MTDLRTLTCSFACLLTLSACETKTNDDAANDESGTTTASGDGDGDLGGDGDGDNEANSGDCGLETVTVLDDLSQVPTGFEQSAADMIAELEGSFAGTFYWEADDGGGWGNIHAGTDSPLSAAVTHAGGEVRLIEVELAGQFPNGDPGGVPCSNRLSVDVDLGFATDDGVFAETINLPIARVAVPADGETPTWSFYYVIDFATHMGSLSAADFMLNDGTLTGVVLMGSIDDAGLGGSLGEEVEIGMGPDGVVGFGLIADYDAPRI